MRDRKIIEIKGETSHGYGVTGANSVIIELLLDIRELLQEANKIETDKKGRNSL